MPRVNLRFPGQYFDEESGPHYNWNRYYSSVMRRYINSDSVGLEGGVNTYVYGNSNPNQFYDRNGKNPVAGTTIGGVLGGPPGAVFGGIVGFGLGILLGDAIFDNDEESDQKCDYDDEDCKERISDWELGNNGIDAHELKEEYLSRAQMSRFELCRCKDGTVAIRYKGCSGPIIRTWVMVQ